MIIAREKRRNNIAEYVLYMWQIEDLIRANELDMQRLRATVIAQYRQDTKTTAEIDRWYAELVEMMLTEGVRKQGHINIVRIAIMQMEEIHSRLMADPKEMIYQGLYYQVLPAIVQLRAKSAGSNTGEIETCLTAIYGLLTLRLQKKEVSEETLASIKQMSTLLSVLSEKFAAREESTDEALL
ncbi:DUF4924 domain-containing protein [Porphyromonas gingivalis]|uniref:DUF4924 family protein n=1 Tax=Porphyromonas gingivalis TaxID=837 RepID=UPI000974FA11|nr:DUF4924 family protein [Porphyromonas gingivalis]ATS11309.1 DUF4924 domain-containing protein [Porphyromonas gingivalis]SJL30572.1 DUF4924 domain-containing protein [Porphyromonas gingivalis]